jgi:hypothetical protein
MISRSSIEEHEIWLWETIFPLDKAMRREIKDQYLSLSSTMRSIAVQVAIQTHLQDYGYSSMAEFIESQNYDPSDSTQNKYANFWYKLSAGRAMTQKNTINGFFDSVVYPTANLLRHPLWVLIDQRKSVEVALGLFNGHSVGSILKKKSRFRFAEKTPLNALKQSYTCQRIKYFNARTLDSFNALLFIALNQIRVCNHARPTSAEQYAYVLFLFLFGYKYRVLKSLKMGGMMNKLLSPESSNDERERFMLRLSSDLDKISKISKKVTGEYYDEIESNICTATLNWVLSNNHACFK